MDRGLMGRRLTDAEKVQRAAKKALTRSSEKDFDDQVKDLLRRFGWRWVGFGALPVPMAGQGGRTRWLTPVKGDGTGWPDKFILHAAWRRFAWIELKSSEGHPRPEQLVWLYDLDALGLEAHLAYPKDLFALGRILGRPERPANLLPVRVVQPSLGT